MRNSKNQLKKKSEENIFFTQNVFLKAMKNITTKRVISEKALIPLHGSRLRGYCTP